MRHPLEVNDTKLTKRRLRILIADDHYVVRQGLKEVLRNRFEGVEFEEASDGNEVLQLVENQDWDVVLLDIIMPGRGGLDTLKEIKQAKQKLPVIILSMYPEDHYAIRALKLGACAYVCKDSAGSNLVKATEAALRGERYITQSLVDAMAVHLRTDRQALAHETLSDREYQVLCLLGSGKTVKEVAHGLSLSVKTISTYRTRIIEKMGVKNNSQMVRYAVSHKLIDLESGL